MRVPRFTDVSTADENESLTRIGNNMMKCDLRLDIVGCKSALDMLVIIHIKEVGHELGGVN